MNNLKEKKKKQKNLNKKDKIFFISILNNVFLNYNLKPLKIIFNMIKKINLINNIIKNK